MEMTVLFTDVYDGKGYPRTETIEVAAPPASGEDIDDWADEELRPRTGATNFDHDESGYFAEIVGCAQRPDLVGREFSWDV